MIVYVFKWMVETTARFPKVMYTFIQMLCIILFHVLGYRKRVIRQNLENAFPEKQKTQIRQIHHQYVQVIIKYISEAFMVFGDPNKDMKHTCIVHQNNDWNTCFLEPGSTIVMASHFGNWETNVVLLPEFSSKKVVGFYKPLQHKGFDRLLHLYRSRYGLKLVSIEQTFRYMAKHIHEDIAYIFLADQGPFNLNGAHWNQFLHQKTPWYNGAEKLARRLQLPVYYLSQAPISAQKPITEAGWYRLGVKLISTKTNITEEGEITEKYSRILEQEIQHAPQYWLWSHRRWKRAFAAPKEIRT